MEYAQLESRITFLDKEYRREKADLAQLRQQLELSEAEKSELANRVEALEEELLQVKSQLSKITMLEGVVERFKGEMMTMLEHQRQQQVKSLKDAQRARAIEMETQTKTISEIRKEVERQRDLDELITLARTETERQGAVMVSFQQRMDNLASQTDEHVRSVSYLEEHRRSDAKRLNEIRADTADLFKQSSLQLSKIELLEQQIPQFGRFQIELEKVRETVRAELDRSQEQQARVQRSIKDFEALSEGVQRRLDDYQIRMERYAEHYQRNLKALESLQVFQEQLQRDQHEFMELQRLNADRQKNKFEEWQSAQEQQTRKQMLENEHKTTELLKQVNKLQDNMISAIAEIEPIKAQLLLLLKIVEEDALSRAIVARDWQVRFEQLATGEE